MVEAIADFNFVASSDDELSIKRDDLLLVFSNPEENWCSASHMKTDKTGLVPLNYITVKPCGFLQQVTREGAVIMLQGKPEGAFLVRQSESDAANERNYSLSVKYQGAVQHFKILIEKRKFFLWMVTFRSLNELVDYYNTESICHKEQVHLQQVQFEASEAAPVFNNDMPPLQAIAQFDFMGEDKGDLKFKSGQKIEITRQLDDHWWEGRLRPKAGERPGKTGVFPACFVKVIE